jgi:hypothetical protein
MLVRSCHVGRFTYHAWLPICHLCHLTRHFSHGYQYLPYWASQLPYWGTSFAINNWVTLAITVKLYWYIFFNELV